MYGHRVAPNQSIQLDRFDPDDTQGFAGGKQAGKAQLKTLNQELETLQELLYAEGRHKLLLVLQGMDASGKDGAIRHVFEGVNPQGVTVANFKAPSQLELAHDYLWRVHHKTPANGHITIFNRSHYEDVLVVRVKNLAPQEVWERRYEHINAFEKLLADEGATILKFFLHISPDEQKERLQARLDDPAKHWKFNPNDLKERARWADYQQAYEAALSKTSAGHAPWYIIPANRKWFRNLAIAAILVETLKGLDMRSPGIDFDPKAITIE
jgi:PPK2 family polyphosphate:nucleotide phosphotransferase